MSDRYTPYTGNDLGCVYTEKSSTFRLWAPTAENVEICFFKNGDGDCLLEKVSMNQDINGTWFLEKNGNLAGTYYTYLVTQDREIKETQDPYGKACGVNGNRSMVIKLESTNPEGFDKDCGPKLYSPTDAIVCEISVRDMTADVSSGVRFKGKYLGLTEKGTMNINGVPTGLDYIKSLGVTHVQLMPSYDFGSVDEARPEANQYNWGYDTTNYNIPEGSYSTDPFHGEVRIKEFKQMVQAFHKEGIGVIMDVVYNHTYDIENSCFQKTVKDYYYRMEGTKYSDASACGNEVASDKPMMRKYIIDSVKYWAEEYHIDGFRFDLMGVLDLETMRQIRAELEKINPYILLYGEGWAGGPSVLSEEERALKVNVNQLKGIAMFSDDMRDGIKGHVFTEDALGFVNGGQDMENDIRFSVVGAIRHPQVDYEKYKYTPEGPWAKDPKDVVNYASCHDNLTLWDKLLLTCPTASRAELLAMNRLSAAIVFTSQGMPFFLSGEEFARSKPYKNGYSENSFNLPVEVNSLKYDRLSEFKELCDYYRGLIAFRKSHIGLRMGTKEEVLKNLCFFPEEQKNVVAYVIKEREEEIFVVYNANPEQITISLPDDETWQVYAEGSKAGTEVLGEIKNQTELMGVSCLIACKAVKR